MAVASVVVSVAAVVLAVLVANFDAPVGGGLCGSIMSKPLCRSCGGKGVVQFPPQWLDYPCYVCRPPVVVPPDRHVIRLENHDVRPDVIVSAKL